MIKADKFGKITRFIMGRLIDEKPVYTMACYYIDGLLIDTGPVHVANEIETAFKDIKINTIVNTHHHEDHIGNNYILQEKFHIGPALAHHLAVPLIINPSIWIGRLRAYQHLAWGTPPPSAAIPIDCEIRTSNHRFIIIHTPGHSPDHICLLEPEMKWLFAGDLFIKEEIKMLRSDEDFRLLLESLYKLLNYQFETIFCCSGRIVNNAREAVNRKIAYWESLQKQVLKLNAQGITTDTIRNTVLGPESVLYEPTEGDFGKINLVKSILRNC